MTRPTACRTRLLPEDRRLEAAVHAVTIDARNLPAGIGIDDLGGGGGDRLAVVVNKWWGPSVDLTVGFLDDPPRELRDKILLHMNAWAQDCAVRFHEVGTDPIVRIGRFTDADLPEGGGYWSYLGTDVGLIPADEPTLNLEGFTVATADSEFRRVVCHEAGHTLGFPHEHMRQELVARLDREKVIVAYMASEGWSEQDVVDQILTPLEEASIFGTATAEETSIMCYQIDGDLTLDGMPILGGTDITETDRQFAALVYPRRGSI
jgi:hypothetical protein